MIYADFDFYKNNFHGILIKSEEEYVYFAERAGDELALFAKRIPNNVDAQDALKRCASKIADIMYGDFKTSKFGVGGGKISSESVSGYYSVSYSYDGETNGVSAIRKQVNSAIVLYLGQYVLGARKVII